MKQQTVIRLGVRAKGQHVYRKQGQEFEKKINKRINANHVQSGASYVALHTTGCFNCGGDFGKLKYMKMDIKLSLI